MLPKSPKCQVVLKVVASLIFLLSGLDSHVAAQTVTEAGKLPEMGVLTIRWDNAGQVKIDAKMCLMEDVLRVVAAIARKQIRIESLPDAAMSLDYNDTYNDVDLLFHAIVRNQDVEVTKEGNIYVIRKKKS